MNLIEPKLAVFESNDGTNRVMYLAFDPRGGDWRVTLERDGVPTGFDVPLRVCEVAAAVGMGVPVDWATEVVKLEWMRRDAGCPAAPMGAQV